MRWHKFIFSFYLTPADGEHQPIISLDLWEKATNKRTINSHVPPKLYEGDFFLTGMLKCPQCGASMVGHRVVKKGKQGEFYRYYICNKDISVCHSNLVNADKAESDVINKLLELVNNPNIIKLIFEKINRKDYIDEKELNNKAKNLKRKLNELKKNENKYYDFLIDENKLKILSEDKILEKIQAIQIEIFEIEKEILNLENSINNFQNSEISIEFIQHTLENFLSAFNYSSIEQKKQLLNSLIDYILVSQGKKTKDRKLDEINLYFLSSDLDDYL